MAYKGLESKMSMRPGRKERPCAQVGHVRGDHQVRGRVRSRVHDRLEERTGLMPWPKIAPRCHELGMREATTRSLESAIMAPSLNTASSTISSVGKYLCESNYGLDMHSCKTNPLSTVQLAPLQLDFASAQQHCRGRNSEKLGP